MINIVIVDDEMLARMGIKSYLENSHIDCQITTFSEVKSALDFIENNNTDIVITDIEMAEIDGIEFIALLKQKKESCHIIVLSAHENFEYARKSFQYGADSYILKHELSKDNLIETIETLKETYLKKQVNQDITTNIEEQLIVTALIQFETTDEHNKEDVDWEIITQIIDGLLKEKSLGKVLKTGTQPCLHFNFNEGTDLETVAEKISKFIRYCNNTLENYIDYKGLWGISQISTDYSNQPLLIKQAQIALIHSFYHENKHIFFYDKEPEFTELLPSIPKLKSSELLDPLWIENAENLISHYLDLCKSNKTLPLLAIKHLENELYYFTTNCLEYYSITDKLLNKKLVLQNEFGSLGNYITVKQQIVNYLFEFQQIIKNILDSRDSFYDIVNYIDNHFMEDLNLQELSAKFFINSNYLSQKFKKEIGVTFSDYLNHKRIDEAKKLILQNQFSMEEIALHTGYKSLNYMSRIFKKVTGETPSHYYKRVFEKQIC